MSNETTALTCPSPLVLGTNSTGGYAAGAFCGHVTTDLICCIPCPFEQYFYTDNFSRDLNIAYWLNVPALVCQVFLLLTFLVLPTSASHRHYLSTGLVTTLIICELSFIVPLGTKPDTCWDNVKPRDMYSSASCAWSGALLIFGAMGSITWVFLRTLWTHLKVCWDVKDTRLNFWANQIFGWGIPGLFLALTMPITGVSYRIGTTCLPNQPHALATWIAWLIVLSCLAALIQFVTTCVCFWVYWRQKDPGDFQPQSNRNTVIASANSIEPPPLAPLGRRKAWMRTTRVLKLQWRSILLTVVGIVETVFFSVLFLKENAKLTLQLTEAQQAAVFSWVLCYNANGGDKSKCPTVSQLVGLQEAPILAAFFIVAVVGILTFLLMVRRSMFTGWLYLLHNPTTFRRERFVSDNDDATLKRKSLGLTLESEKLQALDLRSQPKPSDFVMSPGILPSPAPGSRTPSIPQPGDVTMRHETVNWFDEREEDDLIDQEKKRLGRVDEGNML